MNDNIVKFDGSTTVELDPDDILKAAIGKMDTALILGFTKDGQLYVASSDADVGQALLVMEIAKSAMIDTVIS